MQDPATSYEPQIVLSPDQVRAVRRVQEWFVGRRAQRFVLAGYAGTGKTTIIREILRFLPASTAVCALAGKAAHVLRTKGIQKARTIHSLIYEPVKVCKSCSREHLACIGRNDEIQTQGLRELLCPQAATVTRFVKAPMLRAEMVVVDEASMVNTQILFDLESYGVPVLYIGDHGQLPPIGPDPGIMLKPDVRLEAIHRQAAGSSIIQFAHHLRRRGTPAAFGSDGRVVVQSTHPTNLTDYDVVLCGFNNRRVGVNAAIRRMRNFEGKFPQVGETVICLRNERDLGLFNGMQATVVASGTTVVGRRKTRDAPRLSLEDAMGTRYDDIICEPNQFGTRDRLDASKLPLFDFGYCLTVHKAQGSEWRRVLVIEQLHHKWEPERWRYTAATRAAETLTYVCRPEFIPEPNEETP